MVYFRDDNTWEPEENLDLPELIAAFELSRKASGSSENPTDATATTPATPTITTNTDLSTEEKIEKQKHIIEDNRPRGFDRGFEPDKIVGATDATGELMFLMMWKNCKEADLVPARQANVKCPEVVLKYYESKKPWCNFENNCIKIDSTMD